MTWYLTSRPTSQPFLTTTLTLVVTLDLTLNFGYDIPSSYTLTKSLNTLEPVSKGAEISFTIRITTPARADRRPAVERRLQHDLSVVPLRDPGARCDLEHRRLEWNDLTLSFGRQLAPGASFAIVVNFTGVDDTSALPPDGRTINTATVHDIIADPDGPGPMAATKPLAPQSAVRGVTILAPTGLSVTGFTATTQEDGVLLTWQTASEVEILGFNVLRDLGNGQVEVINPELIFAENPGANSGASYRYTDSQPVPGTQGYLLEVVRLDGSTERLGPVSPAH